MTNHHSHSARCHELMTQISAYIDAELEAHLCAELEQHLENCVDCRIILNTTQKTIELYRRHYRLGSVALPPAIESRLRQALADAGYASPGDE